MKPRNKKSVLITIIVLLIIFLPLAFIGTINHFENSASGKSTGNNKNKEFYYNGKLYFYNGDELLGTYECSNKLCDYAYETMDDSKYGVNSFNDSSVDQITMINNKYAFLIDTEASNVTNSYDNIPINLYNIEKGMSMSTFQAVKNYTMGLDKEKYIVKNNEGLWGVVSFVNDIRVVIPYSYKFIGVHNELSEDGTKLRADTFIVLDEEGWKLIDSNNTVLTSSFNNPIFDYTDNYVITKENDLYYLNNYQGVLMNQTSFEYIGFMEGYMTVIESGEFYFYDPVNNITLSGRYPVSDINDVSYNLTESGLELSISGSVVETIPIQ